ncbi:MAG: hypothetical protein ACI8UO_002965 [Verrucomicrobiales bacterium]|jgi:hypothetical protein
MASQISTPSGRFLLGFAILMALIACFTVIDAGQRESLEEFKPDPAFAETALYDQELFPNEKLFKIGQEIARIDDKPYFGLRNRRSDRPDHFLVRVGRDDTDHFWIYREIQRDRQKAPEEHRFFLKLGRREFLQITDLAPGE